MAWLRAQGESNGKVGLIGFCSGGRHVWLCAGSLPNVDAAVDCWGGNKFADNKGDAEKRPVPPIELTEKITAPILGIYGNDDKNPSPDDVNKTEERVKKAGKNYEFHRYDGAGHGFFAVPREGYRPAQATDAWKKVFAFYNKYLSN
jgi:carboxymethylenebutenolidase